MYVSVGYTEMDIAWMRDHFLQTSESGNKMLIAAAPEQIHQYPQAQVYTTGLYVPPIPPTYDMDDDQNMVTLLFIFINVFWDLSLY